MVLSKSKSKLTGAMPQTILYLVERWSMSMIKIDAAQSFLLESSVLVLLRRKKFKISNFMNINTTMMDGMRDLLKDGVIEITPKKS